MGSTPTPSLLLEDPALTHDRENLDPDLTLSAPPSTRRKAAARSAAHRGSDPVVASPENGGTAGTLTVEGGDSIGGPVGGTPVAVAVFDRLPDCRSARVTT